MQIDRLHDWQVSTRQAVEIQRQMAGRIDRTNHVFAPHFVAGEDMSVDRVHKTATAAMVVLSFPELKLVETRVVQGELTFPYVPGLLSFREVPLILEACRQLTVTPDLVLVDGQGIAHPRRMGLASHLGLTLNVPAIGCAKSLLCGSYEPPPDAAGSYTEIVDDGDVIAAALRTRAGSKPVFVSIGHRVDLPTAIEWVLKCCRGYRLPEPTRLAHLASKGGLAPVEREILIKECIE